MNILEMTDKIELLKQEASNLLSGAKNEVRKLTDDEDKRYNEILVEIKELENAITEERTSDKKNNNKIINNNLIIKTKMNERFNLLTAIKDVVEGRGYSDATNAMVEEGKRSMASAGQSYKGSLLLPFEYRADIIAGTDANGGYAVPTDKWSIVEPLRAALVSVRAGAQLITGLVGDVSIPTYSGSNVLWKGETTVAADGAGTFSEIELKPKRLTALLDISKQFLIQTSGTAEEMLKRDLVNALAGKLEATIFGKHTTDATMPDGFFTDISGTTISGSTSWADIVALETGVDTSNALQGNLAYITNAAGRGLLKSTDKATGAAQFILVGNEMNGYPVYVTNHMATGLQTGGDEHGIIFGNWADLIIGQWGALDVTVDPYTLASYGKIRLVINAYFDAKVRRAASFQIGSLK